MTRATRVRLIITLLLLASLIPVARLTVHAAPLPDTSAPDGTLWRWLGGGDMSDVFFLGDGRHGWAATTQGFLLRTEDGGATWQYVPGAPVSKVYFVSAYRGYGIGGGGIWLTTDGGLTWTAQQTGVHGSDIQFVSVAEGWVAAGSAVYRTTDGGNSWPLQASITATINAISFADNFRGWISAHTFGDSDWTELVYQTNDSGRSWGIVAIFPTIRTPDSHITYTTPRHEDILFTDPTEGWIVGSDFYAGTGFSGSNVVLLHTTDGGLTWSKQGWSPNAQSPDVPHDSFGSCHSISLHGTAGWAWCSGATYVQDVGREGRFVLATADGGASWGAISLAQDPKRFSLPEWMSAGYHGLPAAFFVSTRAVSLNQSQHGMIGAGGNLTLFVSQDAGKTFQPAAFADGADRFCRIDQRTIDDIDAPDPDQAWLLLCHRSILYSGDSGKNWDLLWTPSSATLEDMNMVTATHGWIVASTDRYDPDHDRYEILATADGGHSWERQYENNEGLSVVSFTDTRHGWALMGIYHERASANLLHTADGGQTWITQTANASMTAIQFVSPTLGWGVGISGTIQHTTDGGQTWHFQDSGTTATLNDLDFVDADNGWIVGEHGTILRTRDGGATWANEPSGTTAHLTRIDMADAFNGWVIGDGGLILGRHLIPPPPATRTPTPTITETATNTPMPTETPTVTSPAASAYIPLVLK